MPLQMAVVCHDACLQTVRPLSSRATHSLQGDLCRYFHDGYLQTVHVVVALSASHVVQNSPQFIVHGVEVWTPRGPILGADKGRNVPPQPLPVDTFSSRDTIYCFQGEFQRIRSRTGLSVASAVTLFRRPVQVLS